MSDYPEHDKLHKVADKSQAVGDFLEWLQNKKEVVLCKWKEWEEEEKCIPVRKPDGSLEETRMYAHKAHMPIYISTEKLLSEFFEIDLVKLETEKLTMIEVLRQSPGGG